MVRWRLQECGIYPHRAKYDTGVDLRITLSKQFPSCAEHLLALAEIWDEELNRIINRMLEISAAEKGLLPIQARHEAIFEVAKLRLLLEERIISAKTKSTSIGSIDPSAEKRSLEGPVISQRIENTARILADRIWNVLLGQWHKQFPAIIVPSENTKRRPIKMPERDSSSTIRRQHFTPTFSNKYWASGSERKVRVYRRGINEAIVWKDLAYRKWGYEKFLYSQQLERWFSLVEGDASGIYSKLLDMIPFGELERRYWVAFIIIQLLRTPTFIETLLPGLAVAIVKSRLNYPTDVASLRRAYETLFEQRCVRNVLSAPFQHTLENLGSERQQPIHSRRQPNIS